MEPEGDVSISLTTWVSRARGNRCSPEDGPGAGGEIQVKGTIRQGEGQISTAGSGSSQCPKANQGGEERERESVRESDGGWETWFLAWGLQMPKSQ